MILPSFTLTVDAPKIMEGDRPVDGDPGSKLLTYTLTLDHAPGEAVTINYQTAPSSTATAGDDFDATAGTVTFAAGQTVATVDVTVHGDIARESNETVDVTFSGAQLTAPVTATGLIIDELGETLSTVVSVAGVPTVSVGTPYSLIDTVAHLAAAPSPVLAGAQNVTVTDDLTVAQLTTIQGAAPGVTINYNLADTGAALAAASGAVWSGATTIDATDNTVTLTDAQITDAIIAKFDASDSLTLNATLGTTLSSLSAAALADPDVVALNATDNTVTLTDAQITDAIIAKFDASDNLTLNAALGTTLSGLSAAALGDSDVVALNAGDNAVTLTAAQFRALDAGGGLMDATDAITITSDAGADTLDLNGAGGIAVLVVFDQLADAVDSISNFALGVDGLHFSKAAFHAAALPDAGESIANGQLLSGAGLTVSSATGSTYFLYDTANGNLFYDANGNAGGALQIATLTGAPALDAIDLVMIA